jgi:uncharacterized damage-inducible protein DinB
MPQKPFIIAPFEGYSPRMAELIVMMSYARETTLREVRNLSQNDLDAHPHGFTNSIGMLLEHMAAVEVWYQVFTFENRKFNEAEAKRWHAGLDLGEINKENIKGHDTNYYLSNLKEVREQTLSEFAKRTDDWLYEETEWYENENANNYFKWFHVFEDEINHRGQIRLLKHALKQT